MQTPEAMRKIREEGSMKVMIQLVADVETLKEQMEKIIDKLAFDKTPKAKKTA